MISACHRTLLRLRTEAVDDTDRTDRVCAA
jgi:hypothetical protein